MKYKTPSARKSASVKKREAPHSSGESMARPFDLLNEAIGKEVLIQLKNGMQIRGVLTAFDAHMNVTLDDAEELDGVEVKRKLGKIIVRGDTIIFVSPA